MSVKNFLRVNYRPLTIMVIVLIIITFSLINKDPDIYDMIQNNKFQKITIADDIPDRIYNHIKGLESQGDLKHGVWFFSHSGRKDEVCYILFSGGNEYANGYDVVIVDQKNSTYEHVSGKPVLEGDLKVIINYKFKIVESNESTVKYYNDVLTPIVIFKAKEQLSISGELASVFINQYNERLWIKNVISK